MKLAIDTNSYTNFCKGYPEIVSIIQKVEKIFMPFIVLAELRAGFAASARSAKNEEILNRFLNSQRVEILFADEQTTYHYARLFFQLRKQGTPIPTNDLWIAALTSQHHLFLLTQDSHFDHLPQIPRPKLKAPLNKQ